MAKKPNYEELEQKVRDLEEVLQKRRHAEEALREGEEKFKAIFDFAADALHLIDGGKFIANNEKAVRMYGYRTKEHMLGATPMDISPERQPDGQLSNEKAIKYIKEALTGKPQSFYWKHKRRDTGELFDVDVTLCRIVLGDKTYLLTAGRDITERKRTEEALRESESSLKKSQQLSHVGSWELNLKDNTVKFSDELSRMYGMAGKKHFSLETALGMLLPEDMETTSQALSESLSKGRLREKTRTYRFKRADGEIGWAMSIPPEVKRFGKDGKPEVIIGTVQDITEQRLTQEIMIQTEKMLSVGGLAAGMAHEIKNPLGGIVQTVQVLRNRLFGDLTKNKAAAEECGISMEAMRRYMDKRSIGEMMDTVMESGNRANKIIENMLSFSRKSDYTFAEHDLRDLLDRTVEIAGTDYDLKKKYDFRQIDVEKQYSDSIPVIQCESSEIQQVYLNILKNGAEAMSEADTENPHFILRVRQEGDAMRVEIEDNGPGMDEETKKRIFEPFFTTKEAGKGTGLGMSLSYYIITENHGGTMSVESTPGKGAKFIIRLPLGRKAKGSRKNKFTV